jgi:hypothetical protein
MSFKQTVIEQLHTELREKEEGYRDAVTLLAAQLRRLDPGHKLLLTKPLLRALRSPHAGVVAEIGAHLVREREDAFPEKEVLWDRIQAVDEILGIFELVPPRRQDEREAEVLISWVRTQEWDGFCELAAAVLASAPPTEGSLAERFWQALRGARDEQDGAGLDPRLAARASGGGHEARCHPGTSGQRGAAPALGARTGEDRSREDRDLPTTASEGGAVKAVAESRVAPLLTQRALYPQRYWAFQQLVGLVQTRADLSLCPDMDDGLVLLTQNIAECPITAEA